MFRRFKEKLEEMNLYKSPESKFIEELRRFVDMLGLETLTEEEIEFYNQNLDTSEYMRLDILQNIALVKGFEPTIFEMCSAEDFCILNVMIAKYLIQNDNLVIGELLLSNKSTSILNYSADEVFEIIKRNYIDGLSEEVMPIMEQMMQMIKSTVISVCINPRKMVLCNDTNNGQEVVMQPRDIVAGLVSIILEGDR